MKIEAYIGVLEFLFVMGIIIWFFRGPWQRLLVDITRQRIFEIRDEVFDLALNGDLDFNSKVYKDIRNRFNMIIQFCHNAKFSRVIASAYIDDEYKKSRGLLDMIEDIEDKKLRRKLEIKTAEVFSIISILIVLRSPLLLIVTPILLPIIMIQQLFGDHIKKLFSLIGNSIDKDINPDNQECA